MIGNQSGEELFSFANITGANRFFHLDNDKLASLLIVAAVLHDVEAAGPLLERFHRLFFHTGMEVDQAADLWKEEGAFLKDLRTAAGALLIMSGITHLIEFYHGRNIPDSV